MLIWINFYFQERTRLYLVFFSPNFYTFMADIVASRRELCGQLGWPFLHPNPIQCHTEQFSVMNATVTEKKRVVFLISFKFSHRLLKFVYFIFAVLKVLCFPLWHILHISSSLIYFDNVSLQEHFDNKQTYNNTAVSSCFLEFREVKEVFIAII